MDWRAASWAGFAYTLGVFVFAFAVGTIRVTLVAPRLGPLLAVIIEAPIVRAVSWRVSLWCTRRFNVSRDARERILMGAAAFAVPMLLELGFSVLVFGETVGHYFAKYTSTPGVVGLMMQGCFATLPWIQSHLRWDRLERPKPDHCSAQWRVRFQLHCRHRTILSNSECYRDCGRSSVLQTCCANQSFDSF